jgi:hypothetical protein
MQEMQENTEIKEFLINSNPYKFIVISNPALIHTNNLWSRIWPSSLLLSSILESITTRINKGFDLGTGLGMNAIMMTKFCKSVLGVDMIPAGLLVASQSAILNRIDNVDFKVYNWNNKASFGRMELMVAADCLYLSNSLKPIASLTRDLLLSSRSGLQDNTVDNTGKGGIPGIGLFVSPSRGFEQDFCDLLAPDFKVELYRGSFTDLPCAVVVLCFQEFSELLLELRQKLIDLNFVIDPLLE